MAARIGPASRLLLCGQRHGLNAGLLVDRVPGLRDDRDLRPAANDDAVRPWQKSLRQDAAGRLCWELDTASLVKSGPNS